MNGEGYTSKFAATSLIPSYYPHVNSNNQQELLAMFISVSREEIPQVRKVAATVINDMIKLIPKVPEQELLKIFDKFF